MVTPKDQGFSVDDPITAVWDSTSKSDLVADVEALVDSAKIMPNETFGQEIGRLMNEALEAIYPPGTDLGLYRVSACCPLRATGSPLHDVWCDSWTDPCKPDVVHENLAGFPCDYPLENLGCPECQTSRVAYCRACAMCTACGASPRSRPEYSGPTLLEATGRFLKKWSEDVSDALFYGGVGCQPDPEVYGKSIIHEALDALHDDAWVKVWGDMHEALAKEPNPILKDLVFKEGVPPTHTVRTALPPLTWRAINPVLAFIVVHEYGVNGGYLERGDENVPKGTIFRSQKTTDVQHLEKNGWVREVCGDVLVDIHSKEDTCVWYPDHDGQHQGSNWHWNRDDPHRQEMRDRPPRYLTEEEEQEAVRRYGSKHEGGWLCFRHPDGLVDLESTDGAVLPASRKICGMNSGECKERRPIPECLECGCDLGEGHCHYCDDGC